MQPCDPFRHVVRSNAQPGWYVARVQFEQMPKSSFPERRQNGQTCDATNHGRLRQPGPPPARQAENPRMGHGVRAMEMETGGMGDRVPVKPTSATPPSLPSPWSLAALLSRCWGATHTSPSALPTESVTLRHASLVPRVDPSLANQQAILQRIPGSSSQMIQSGSRVQGTSPNSPPIPSSRPWPAVASRCADQFVDASSRSATPTDSESRVAFQRCPALRSPASGLGLG